MRTTWCGGVRGDVESREQDCTVANGVRRCWHVACGIGMACMPFTVEESQGAILANVLQKPDVVSVHIQVRALHGFLSHAFSACRTSPELHARRIIAHLNCMLAELSRTCNTNQRCSHACRVWRKLAVSAADKDPVLAALPAETRERVERALKAYETEASPAKAEPLWPEIPLPGETVTAPPLPKQPPRKRPGPGYCSGSQPDGWAARCLAQSRRPPRPPPKPLPERPAWNSKVVKTEKLWQERSRLAL